MTYENIRIDHRVILELVEPRSTVLDLGCGTGELLYILIKEKNVRGQGIEIDDHAIYKCVAKGLNVFHGDIDSGLSEYNDKSVDYVILNQSLQQVKHVDSVLSDALVMPSARCPAARPMLTMMYQRPVVRASSIRLRTM